MTSRVLLFATALVAALATGAFASTLSVDYSEYPGRIGDIDFAPPREAAPPRFGAPDQFDLAEQGDLVFVALGSDGLDIRDDPGTILGQVNTNAYSIALSGDPNCIWIGGDGIVHRVDVSDPENPMVVDTVSLPGTASRVHDLSMSGDMLLAQTVDGAFRLVTSGPCGIVLTIDGIPSSTSTTLESDLNGGTGALIGSGILLVADMNANPPTVILRTVPGLDNRDVLVLNESEVVVATATGLKRYGAPIPSDIDENPILTNLRRITHGPNMTMIATEDSGLLHLVSDQLLRTATLASPPDGERICYADGTITVLRSGASTSPGLTRFRYGNGMSPIPHQVIADDVFVPEALTRTSAQWAILSDHGGMSGGRVRFYDCSTPDDCNHAGDVDAPAVTDIASFTSTFPRREERGTSTPMAILGSLLEFDVLDASDPANPQIIGSIPASSSTVAASPDGAIVLRSSSSPLGFYLVDVSDPSSPGDLGFVSTPNGVNDALVDGNFVVVATTGLTGRWNVSDPNAPILDHATTLTGVRSVAQSAVSDQAFLGSTGSGERVVRYDFATQTELSEVRVGAGVLAVVSLSGGALQGGSEIVYAGDDAGSIFVIDWTNPGDPILVGEYTEGGLTVNGLAATDETVMVTNGSFPGNVLVLPAHAPGVTTGTTEAFHPIDALFGNSWPNPFASSTTLAFTLTRRTDVHMDVFDVRGRRVRRLTSGAFAAGRHTIRFDGRDDGGSDLGSGVYFIRIVAGSRVDHQKVKLVR